MYDNVLNKESIHDESLIKNFLQEQWERLIFNEEI